MRKIKKTKNTEFNLYTLLKPPKKTKQDGLCVTSHATVKLKKMIVNVRTPELLFAHHESSCALMCLR